MACLRGWRASTLGRITDSLEHDLLLDLIEAAPGASILDAGCGDGKLAMDLAECGANVVGIDASPDMIASARERALAQRSNVAFRTGRVEALPFDTDAFDVVVSMTVFCFLRDPAAAADREMRRVVQPGGVVVLGELGRWSSWPAIRRMKGWLGASRWRDARFWTARELQKLTAEAGLTPTGTRGAVFYPPNALLARLVGRLDAALGQITTLGAAFIAVAASKSFGLDNSTALCDVTPANRQDGDES